MTEEIWKDVKGFEGFYQISSLGRVKSIPRILIRKDGKSLNIKEKILKPYSNREGYSYVTLTKDTKQYSKAVHRLVCEAFLPNPYNLPVVNHKNEIKSDNRIENLEWSSYSYNVIYNGNSKRIATKLKGRPAHNRIEVILPDGTVLPSIAQTSKMLNKSYKWIYSNSYLIQDNDRTYRKIYTLYE